MLMCNHRTHLLFNGRHHQLNGRRAGAHARPAGSAASTATVAACLSARARGANRHCANKCAAPTNETTAKFNVCRVCVRRDTMSARPCDADIRFAAAATCIRLCSLVCGAHIYLMAVTSHARKVVASCRARPDNPKRTGSGRSSWRMAATCAVCKRELPRCARH